MKPTRLLIVGTIVALAAVAVLFTLHQLEGRLYPQAGFSSAAWANDPFQGAGVSARQKMLRDLVVSVLPHKNRSEVEALLGKSPTHDEMRRMTPEDFRAAKRNEDGTWTYPRSGTGFYYSKFDWDLIYFIGTEQTIAEKYDLPRLDYDIDRGEREALVLRFDSNGVFSSWYINGSKLWPRIVGEIGQENYSERRRVK